MNRPTVGSYGGAFSYDTLVPQVASEAVAAQDIIGPQTPHPAHQPPISTPEILQGYRFHKRMPTP